MIAPASPHRGGWERRRARSSIRPRLKRRSNEGASVARRWEAVNAPGGELRSRVHDGRPDAGAREHDGASCFPAGQASTCRMRPRWPAVADLLSVVLRSPAAGALDGVSREVDRHVRGKALIIIRSARGRSSKCGRSAAPVVQSGKTLQRHGTASAHSWPMSPDQRREQLRRASHIASRAELRPVNAGPRQRSPSCSSDQRTN
jgi:hypothetical protein